MTLFNQKIAERQRRNLRTKPYASLILTTLVLAVALLALSACGSTPAASENKQATNVAPFAKQPSATNQDDSKSTAPTVKDADLIIPVADVTAKAAFYPVEVDGTKLEVIAVKAPDGSIRTAYNTCQVCFDSGRGYYVQEGKELVCQNCGNRFGMDQVQVKAGGCNPVPIFDKDKTAGPEQIIVPLASLQEAKTIFANWKK